MPNFSSLAGLEVPEKFVGGGSAAYMMRFCSLYGEHVGTVSNPTKLLLSCFELS